MNVTSLVQDTLPDTIIYSDTTATDLDKEYDRNSQISYRIIKGTQFSVSTEWT